MAEMASRSRDQPDIRARISIHDDGSPNDIKELQLADQTQRALRSKHSWSPPEAIGSLQRAALRKARTLPYPYRPGHFNDVPASDALPCPINRSNSFTSLSTVQREAEAASLSLYRGSPISAIGSSYPAPSWTAHIDEELQDPCPPRPHFRVETLSQQKKIQKQLRKSLKKQEKEQEKAQREKDQLHRAFIAAEVAAVRRKDAARARGEVLPLRSKSTKSIASQVVKSLSLKSPLSRLTRHVRRGRASPPTLDDFDSKSAIRAYLNPSPFPAPSTDAPFSVVEPAELPAELPQYTPFQDLTRTQDNEPVALLEDASVIKEKGREALGEGPSATISNSQPKQRSMRCDSCQSPIRLDQVYYHCSVCEHGDRILCAACDQAGWSCRHDITEKVRSVTRSDSVEKAPVINLVPEPSPPEVQQHVATHEPPVMDKPHQSNCCANPQREATLSAACPWAINDDPNHEKSYDARNGPGMAGRFSDQTKQLNLQRREYELGFREKEISLRERENDMIEQRTSLREQEALLHVQQQLFSLQMRTAIASQSAELSTGFGAQFQDLSHENNIRVHATKRKVGARSAGVSPTNSTGSGAKSSPKRTPSGGHGPDEEDEDESNGTPKKIKADPDAQHITEKLFACPFCKYDKSKYSEQNVHEKQYRGCSSGYWPDISRLKQHLYRVHWRRIHCTRCFVSFTNKEKLDEHRREVIPCTVTACPWPEKFDELQYNEIRRKRPTTSPEDVWYTIYNILFPGLPKPASPYADHTEASSTVSPAIPETRNTMDVLGEVFESRLNHLTSLPGQGWLQSIEARQLIREQLRASMSDVLQKLRPANSPYLGEPSLDVSPISAGAPESARRGSMCLTTPSSSIPPSPIHGPGPSNKSESGSHFLLPGHRQSFSRPFSSRTVPKLSIPKPGQRTQNPIESSNGITFPVPMSVDPENDSYDDECHSWSHGDELGLALSTDAVTGEFNFDFSSAFSELHNMNVESTTAAASNFNPVKLASLSDDLVHNSTRVSELKSKHSTASSLDSGYGSLKHTSSSASTAASLLYSDKNEMPPIPVRTGQRHGKQRMMNVATETSPVPESAINFEALDESFNDFSGANLDLNFDEHFRQYDTGIHNEHGLLDFNKGAADLSAYLDGKYPVGSLPPG